MAEITVIGLVSGDLEHVFRGPHKEEQLYSFLLNRPRKSALVGHNFKFDLKHLVQHFKPCERFIELWAHDTLLMAYLYPDKVTDRFLSDYEKLREQLKGGLPRGFSHRRGGPLSLKVLAPYFLDVEPFWEDPSNHDSDEYVLKDTRYTFELCKFFLKDFPVDHFSFYERCQLPWTKVLLAAELSGIRLDVDALEETESRLQYDYVRVSELLHAQWAPALRDYAKLEEASLRQQYQDMATAAVKKLEARGAELDDNFKEVSVRPSADKIQKITERYLALFNSALSKAEFQLNFSSPKQLQWLLRDYLKYDITNYEGKESTDKEVLQRLAQEGKDDVKVFLEYRKLIKILTSYFPKYRELLTPAKRIHTTFNPTGARTGRLSSSSPNMQQVPGNLHSLFAADPGHLLVTKDLSALEPTLIAHFSQDPKLLQIMSEGLSFHAINAQEMFALDCTPNQVADLFPKHRAAAKEIGLAILYGAGAKRCRIALEKRGFKFTEAECKVFVNRLRDSYKVVWQFKEAVDALLKRGETLFNLMGRPIRFFDPEEVYMKGFNRLVQGSGSDWLQEAALQISQIPGCEVKLLVHDELVVQVPERAAKLLEGRIVEAMTAVELNGVKLKVEGGVNKAWVK